MCGARSCVWANLLVRDECWVSPWTELQFLLASTLLKVGHLDSAGALRRHGTGSGGIEVGPICHGAQQSSGENSNALVTMSPCSPECRGSLISTSWENLISASRLRVFWSLLCCDAAVCDSRKVDYGTEQGTESVGKSSTEQVAIDEPCRLYSTEANSPAHEHVFGLEPLDSA